MLKFGILVVIYQKGGSLLVREDWKLKELGVGFLLAPDVVLVDEPITHFEAVWGNILTVRVILDGLKLRITNVHAPHEDYAESTKQKFYSNLKKCRNEVDEYKSGQKILLGDFNAEIGYSEVEEYEGVCGIRAFDCLNIQVKMECTCWIISDTERYSYWILILLDPTQT